jgi:hypothetical protein
MVINMNLKYTLILPAVLLTACSSPTIKGYDGPVALNRDQVIQGARSCVNVRMKPEVISLPQKTPNGTVLVPVDVQCNPYR